MNNEQQDMAEILSELIRLDQKRYDKSNGGV